MPRRAKHHHYIYKTTCLVTGKFYVGMHSTDNLDDGYLGSGKILGYSRKKHGDENHRKEILEHCPSREALKLREKEIVNEELLASPLNINLKYGGEGGWDHIAVDVEVLKQRASKGGKASGHKNIAGARSCITSASKKQGLAKRASNGNPLTTSGLKFSEETKAKMASSGSGSSNSQYDTCWVTNGSSAIKIKKQDLPSHLKNGFVRGRKTVTLA
jgi:hypothetical protein